MPRRQILRRLWQYMGRSRARLVLAVLLTLLSASLGLVGPRLSGLAIDATGVGRGQADIPLVLRLCALMALFYALSSGLSYVLSRVTLRMTRDIVHRMRRDVFDKLVSLPVHFFDRYQAGEIISVVSYDVDTVNETLSSDFLQIVQSVVVVTVSLGMMLAIKPVLALVFLVTVPLTVVYIRWITGRTRPLFRRRGQKLGELNGFMEEMMGGKKTIRAYGREDRVLEAFGGRNAEAVSAYTTSEYYGSMMGPSVGFINNISLALISVFGAALFLAGRVGLGEIAAFVQYSRRFSGPINEAAGILGDLQSALAAAERVFRLMDAVPEKPDAPDAAVLRDVRGDVKAEDVRFGYLPGVPVIRDFDMHARPGELVAIVGPTGAGKTTLVNLLMRFYDADAGRITVDGHDVLSLTRASLRGAYSMVLQDSWLFYGTVLDNIAYARPGATRQEVEEAAKAAMIHGFISRLPKGYDTVIGDDGVNISKGQKQLITIARAMLSDARMLILDEATSNVDTQTEQRIQQAMRKLMAGRTAFVIAHRLSTIRSADRILVVRDGNIVEQGRHEELMEKQGFYAELYNTQFETY
ncbi:MAG TPA: ABC transporter ATP-binding protein [Candidatus Limnocylindria bacterium]|nr:ABC transporter ATP-binding protein [Candidatus Limnocylindria bacterium]